MIILLLILNVLLPHSEEWENMSKDHEYHMSKCDIDYDQEESSLQISVSIFIDDLELALNQRGIDSLWICTKRESEIAEQAIMDYIIEHLVLAVDKEMVHPSWLGKEPSDDLAAVWCYLEVKDVSPQDQIDVSNRILLDSFEDQQNLVKLTYDKKRKAFFLFDNDESTGTLQL